MMNRVNFDSLKNIKAPGEWRDKAALIPETSVKKPAFPLCRIVAAASIVLVGAIGVLLFLLYGDHNVSDLILPSATEPTTFVSETGGDHTGISPTTSAPMLFPTDEQIAPTDEHGQTVAESKPSPTEQKRPSATEPTERIRPTQKAIAPTENAVDSPTQGAPDPTQPPAASTDPPATQEPSDLYPEELSYISAVATFPSSVLRDDDVIYCAIYDHGKLVSQGEASIYIMKNGNVFASYETAVESERGKTYHFSFFRYGLVSDAWESAQILASGTLTY